MKKQLLASSGKIYALAVGVGLFITVLMVSLIWEKALNDRKKLFDFEAGRVWQDVVQKIERNNEALNSLEALYLASLDVSSDQFRIFTGGIFARHPFVSAAVYLPRVSQVRRAEFERNMQDDGFADFRIKQIGTHGGYEPATSTTDASFPILYIEPFDVGNAELMGLDAYSRHALQQAIDRTIATGMEVPVSEVINTGRRGYWLLKAIYAGTNVPAFVDQRRQQVNGVIAFLVDPDKLLDRHLLSGGMKALVEIGIRSNEAVHPALNTPKLQYDLGKFDFSETFSASFPAYELRLIVSKPIRWQEFAYGWIGLTVLAGISLTLALLAFARGLVDRAREQVFRAEEIEQQVKEKTQALSRLSQHLSLLMESAGEGIYGVDRAGKGTFVNRAALEMLGYSKAEMLGHPTHDLIHHSRVDGSVYPENECPIYQVLREGVGCRVQSDVLWRKDGSSFPVEYSAYPVQEDGSITGAVIVFRNVAEARAMAHKMDYLATHDALTGLVNRYEFEQRLDVAIGATQREKCEHAVCYLDLDQFKVVNDTCGHMAGDEMLSQLGALLHAQVRQGDTLARLGGDEFGVLLERCSMEAALKIMNQLRQMVQDFRFVWDEKIFAIGVSIGMVRIDASTESSASALSAADTACYLAKEGGRNRIHVYQVDDVEVAQRHGEMQWVSKIHEALLENRFVLRYQRIVSLQDNDESGECYEVLVSMRDHLGYVVPPGAFLPAAERYNLMPGIDRWVVSNTFKWLADHPLQLARLHLCTINFSGTTLADEQFLGFIVEQLSLHQIPAEKICFEITETAAIANLIRAARFMEELKKLGCRFALDDFGSGMSSFAYLKSLPVDFLKIDGNFVRDIVGDPVDRAMVEAINQVGHVMQIKTIAEFVEDEATFAILQQIKVDYAQGFWVAEPETMEAYVQQVRLAS